MDLNDVGTRRTLEHPQAVQPRHALDRLAGGAAGQQSGEQSQPRAPPVEHDTTSLSASPRPFAKRRQTIANLPRAVKSRAACGLAGRAKPQAAPFFSTNLRTAS